MIKLFHDKLMQNTFYRGDILMSIEFQKLIQKLQSDPITIGNNKSRKEDPPC